MKSQVGGVADKVPEKFKHKNEIANEIYSLHIKLIYVVFTAKKTINLAIRVNLALIKANKTV